jgi:ribosome-binding factor A
MTQSTVKSIKNAKKESLIFREVSSLFLNLILDQPGLSDMTINRIELSRDGGICFVFFYTAQGEESFIQKLPLLILYKPSLRKALAQKIVSRYTPDLVFRFDNTLEKQHRIESLLDTIKKTEEKL